MALTPPEQIKQLLSNAKHILITFRPDDKGDALASSCALRNFLEKQNKQVDIASQGFVVPKKFTFIRSSDTVESKLPHLQQLMISIDVKDAGLQELSYDVKDEKLHIFITPKSGFLTRQHMSTAQSEFRYDLIMTLNTPDLESLGDLYKKNADLFYEVPILNIDHQPNNEHYGQLNLIELTSSATSEVVTNMLFNVGAKYVDKDIATSLMAGMIAATHSFKTENIKPHTLALASKLVSMGADREFIIKHLYQTKSLSMLRLWGQALAHLNYDKEIGLVSTSITRDDFVRSGATEQELYDIIDELIVNAPEEKLTLLLHEHKNGSDEKQIHGILQADEKDVDARALVARFDARGNSEQASFILKDTPLKDAEQLVIDVIRKQLKA